MAKKSGNAPISTANLCLRRGAIVWLEFTLGKGHEQAGRRPAIVLSPEAYNEKSGLMLVCPITSKTKGYPFEVAIAGKARGSILVDQIKSIDWKERNAQFIEQAPYETVQRVKDRLELLLP